MTGREFFDAVMDAAGLTWIDVIEGGSLEADEVIIASRQFQGGMRAVSMRDVIDRPEEVLACLKGDRSFKLMRHVSRIVGYYSRVRNWNRSKLAELADRQKGMYTLQERAA